MLGAITGDIVGSIYEFDNIKTKDFPLFGVDCKFTDDTVLTVAVAEWLLDDGDLVDYFARWYRRCGPDRSYGGMFEQWINQEDRQPYNSWGNGSAMRVSACAWQAKNEAHALKLAKASAEVSHSHQEGIKGAQATALAIFLARQGESSENIRKSITDFSGYDLSESVDEIRQWYYFNESCAETVPQAIICALEATDFEDAIRNAISIGGDSDTIAAITGSIAEAMFGIPDVIAVKARTYLTDEINEVLNRFAEIRNEQQEQSPELPLWNEISGKKLSPSEIRDLGRLAMKGDEAVQKELMELAKEARTSEDFEIAAALYKEAAHAFWFQYGKHKSKSQDASDISDAALENLHQAERYCVKLEASPKYEHNISNSGELNQMLGKFLSEENENLGAALTYFVRSMEEGGVSFDAPLSRYLYPSIASVLNLPDGDSEWLLKPLRQPGVRIALDHIISAFLDWSKE
jgi:ADP-ribosylglycohydrolase